MNTQCSTISLCSTKPGRSYEGSMVVISMDDDRADMPDDLSVETKPNCFKQTGVFQALKPLLFSCYVAGLLLDKNFDKTGYKKYPTITYVYSTLVLIILTVHVIRCLAMFDEIDQFGPLLLFKLVYVTWTMEALGHFIAFYVGSCEYERLPKFLLEWEKVRKDCPLSRASIIKLTKTFTTVVWILVVLFVGFNAYLATCTDSLTMLLNPLNKEHPYVALMIVLNLIMQFYLNFAWIAPSAVMFLFCKIMSIEFKQLNESIKALERKGHMHDKLCTLVGYADNLFSMQLIGSFAGSAF